MICSKLIWTVSPPLLNLHSGIFILGDPGTAKSQLLKFVERVSPIGVYTSGKGSSAAGLTASVNRDPATRNFVMEGGAMVRSFIEEARRLFVVVSIVVC